VLNYLAGAEHCRANSMRLETSARIILKDPNGTHSFGLFLYYIAYEEMAKGIFCLLVHKDYVQEEFVDIVFREHHPKIALFEEIFRSFAVHNRIPYLWNKKIGEIPLEKLIKKHTKEITRHRQETMNFLYVDRNNGWKVPTVKIPDIIKKENEIHGKIVALNMILEFLKTEIDKVETMANNFLFYENPDGTFTIQHDEI
jgi:AbiV family abortive infection protein